MGQFNVNDPALNLNYLACYVTDLEWFCISVPDPVTTTTCMVKIHIAQIMKYTYTTVRPWHHQHHLHHRHKHINL